MSGARAMCDPWRAVAVLSLAGHTFLPDILGEGECGKPKEPRLVQIWVGGKGGGGGGGGGGRRRKTPHPRPRSKPLPF